MQLNNKQRSLCLSHAPGQFLSGWKGSPEEAWQRLQNLSDKNPDNHDFEEAANVVVCDSYEHLFIGALVDQIESAFWASCQLVMDALDLRTKEQKSQNVTGIRKSPPIISKHYPFSYVGPVSMIILRVVVQFQGVYKIVKRRLVDIAVYQSNQERTYGRQAVFTKCLRAFPNYQK